MTHPHRHIGKPESINKIGRKSAAEKPKGSKGHFKLPLLMKMGFTLRKSFGAPGNAQSPAFVFTERGKGNRGGAEKKNIQNSINKT